MSSTPNPDIYYTYGILNSGNFEISDNGIYAPLVVSGSHNNVTSTLNTNAGTKSSEQLPPVKTVLPLSERLEKRLEELREEGASTMALKEFLRPHLVELHDRTVNSDRLALLLHSAKVLSDYQRKKINEKKIESEKNDLLYDYVGQKDAAKELVDALKKSENDYILKLLDKWASDPNT